MANDLGPQLCHILSECMHSEETHLNCGGILKCLYRVLECEKFKVAQVSKSLVSTNLHYTMYDTLANQLYNACCLFHADSISVYLVLLYSLTPYDFD